MTLSSPDRNGAAPPSALVLDMLDSAVAVLTGELRIVYCNRAFLTLWGLDADETVHDLPYEVLLARQGLLGDEDYVRHMHVVFDAEVTASREEFALRNGRIVRCSCRALAADDPTRPSLVLIQDDITEQRLAAERLRQLASRDPLTDLYNRRQFYEALDRTLADAERNGSRAGLVVIDLDNFKPINDRHGHQAGDRVLVALARKLGRATRRNETLFRLGGDEFALLIANADEDGMAKLARRLLRQITSLRFDFEPAGPQLTASIGMAMYPVHASDGEALVAYADRAMYTAKERGKNGFYQHELPFDRERRGAAAPERTILATPAATTAALAAGES